MTYVYTLTAARTRLRRGHRSVRYCVPGTCQLVTLTKRNWKRITRLLKTAGKL